MPAGCRITGVVPIPRRVAINPVVGSEQKKEKDAQAEAVPELPRVSDDIGGVLTPRGRLVLEPSVEYIHSSASRVSIEGFTIIPALLIGIIDIIEANHDTIIGSLAARYGVTNNFEVEVRVPYVYRSDTTVSREFLKPSDAPSVVDATGHDIGDVELGLRYQLPRPSPAWPYMVANLQVKSNTGTDPFELATEASLTGEPKSFDKLPTGTGFWSLNPSLTFIYPSDPVVFFGNVGYLINIPGIRGHLFGEVDPGDAIRLNAGMGIALNDRSSFSLSYQLDKYGSTYIESNKIVGSDVTVGRLLIGYSLKLPGGTPLNLAIAIGATHDAPDSDLTFRVPFDVNLFK